MHKDIKNFKGTLKDYNDNYAVAILQSMAKYTNKLFCLTRFKRLQTCTFA